MFCTNCGKEIAGGVKFCPHCGTEVSNEPVNDELVATLTVDGGNYAATADDSNMRMPISRIIIIILGLVVVAAGVIATTAIYNNYQDYKAQIEHENWIYDTVVAGLNEVDDTVDVPCEPFDKDYVTKGDIEYHDFGKGNYRYVHYEVDVHFKEGDVWYDSFKDGMVTINAYDFIDTDSGIKAYLYYGDLYDEVMKVFFSQNNNDGGTGNVTTEPTASPEPEPTEKSYKQHDADYYESLCIPEGTWLSETEINPICTEVFGLDDDDGTENFEVMQNIYKWVCEEVLTHYAESLPEECKMMRSTLFYPRNYFDVKDDNGEVLTKNGLCGIQVYVPMDVETANQPAITADTVDNYFSVIVSYSKEGKEFFIRCPGKYDLGQDECDIGEKVEAEWKAKKQKQN